MNFKFVVIINLFLLISLTFSAHAKNIPPKLKPDKFIDSSAHSSKPSKFLDNLTKNKKKEQTILKPKNEVVVEEDMDIKITDKDTIIDIKVEGLTPGKRKV